MRVAVYMDSEAESAAVCRALRLWADMVCLSAEISPWSPGQEPLPPDVSALFWDMDGAVPLPLPELTGEGRRRLFLCASDARAAIDSYTLHPTGFLQKPVRMNALRRTMDRCVGAWWNDLVRLEVLCGGLRHQIPLSNLLWVESCRHGSLLHTRGEQFQTREPLRNLEDRLSGGMFLRCQRSFLVNLYHVCGVSQDAITLSNGDRVPVGRRCRAAVLESCGHLRELWGSVLSPKPAQETEDRLSRLLR